MTGDLFSGLSTLRSAVAMYCRFRDDMDRGIEYPGLKNWEGALTFFDTEGAGYQAVRHFNRATGRSAYRVKPVGASNRTNDCLELDTIEEVARAMLIDGLPARVRAFAGGPVNYLRYGGDKIVEYKLDPTIAAKLGIPAASKSSEVIADRIRDYILQQLVEPARRRGERLLSIRAGDVHDALNLHNNYANVCQVLAGSKLQRMGQLPPPSLTGPTAGANTAALFSLRASNPEHRRINTNEANMALTASTNLILHGPPGTGKTFRTVEEAVRLCGEEPPADRNALMHRYRKLSDAGRIEFVTFHQSMAYEEFVEGLRPRQASETNAGFELRPELGIFRRIAHEAETDRGGDAGTFRLGDRQVFKMSIGDATKKEWAWLFDDAIEQGYTYLGFSDIDWTDERFVDRSAILAAVLASGQNGSDVSERSGPVKSPDNFRNALAVGDVIVVSKGLHLFRAIGVIESEYEYAPRPDGRYCHRRQVRWLWHDNDGVPVSEINANRFSIDTIYPLRRSDLNVAALERYANAKHGEAPSAARPFVLIIDEINRANISKVFGELITLLEPDKRIGQANELRVRLPYSGESFGVPANLHIIGTMNTADRSIALIDKALRRRFQFREMMPDYTCEGMGRVIDGVGVPLARILRTINDHIEYLLDREHQVGHAWLMHCDSRASLDAAMRERIIPLIAEYFFEDWDKTAAVLGGADGNNPFLGKVELAAPPGLSGTRTRWTVRESFAPDAYRRLVGEAPAPAPAGQEG